MVALCRTAAAEESQGVLLPGGAALLCRSLARLFNSQRLISALRKEGREKKGGKKSADYLDP